MPPTTAASPWCSPVCGTSGTELADDSQPQMLLEVIEVAIAMQEGVVVCETVRSDDHID